jgi:hypothetical protein
VVSVLPVSVLSVAPFPATLLLFVMLEILPTPLIVPLIQTRNNSAPVTQTAIRKIMIPTACALLVLLFFNVKLHFSSYASPVTDTFLYNKE